VLRLERADGFDVVVIRGHFLFLLLLSAECRGGCRG